MTYMYMYVCLRLHFPLCSVQEVVSSCQGIVAVCEAAQLQECVYLFPWKVWWLVMHVCECCVNAWKLKLPTSAGGGISWVGLPWGLNHVFQVRYR